MTKVAHLGIIPDGGRRWAVAKNVDLITSYRLSMQYLWQLTEAAFDHGVEVVSIYLLSKANLRRPITEIDAISLAILDLLAGLKPQNATIAVAGDLSLVTAELAKALRRETLSSSSSRRVNLCIAYDPTDELRYAQAKASGCDILPHLWVPNPIDLVVRTGGAQTLSNFLPLQCGYARIIFLQTLFNDVGVEQLLGCVHEHESQVLLYGE